MPRRTQPSHRSRSHVAATLRLRLAAGACAALVAGTAVAQTPAAYPTRPLKMIHSFPPGGATDLLARTVAQKMAETLGQPVLVETRPGGATNIGAEVAAKSPPDGYTIYLGIDGTMVMNPWLKQKPAFDPVRDFAPISNLAVQCVLFVGSQKVPGRTLGAIAAYAKANPGKVTIGGSNVLTQLLGEQFRTLAGIDIQYIPFQGSSQQVPALLGAEIDLAVVGVMPYANYIRDGKLVGLATTGAKREPRVPDMPTVREAGFADLEGCNWLGLFAPAATPPRIVERLNAEVAKTLADPAVREKLSSSGLDPSPSTSAELGEMVKRDLAKWKPIVERSALVR
jgi:tripartite-type tricarboxylate transporter receptor subunit TctC